MLIVLSYSILVLVSIFKQCLAQSETGSHVSIMATCLALFTFALTPVSIVKHGLELVGTFRLWEPVLRYLFSFHLVSTVKLSLERVIISRLWESVCKGFALFMTVHCYLDWTSRLTVDT